MGLGSSVNNIYLGKDLVMADNSESIKKMLYIAQWNKDLETGIEEIDSQHMEFLIMANRFLIRYRAEKKSEAALEELKFLQEYLLYHFQMEETYQFESQYPEYGDHQAEHKQLGFKVLEVAIALRDSGNMEAIDNFAVFVNDWVIHHMMVSDLRFTKYYNEWKKVQTME